jgi:hypothetical protein
MSHLPVFDGVSPVIPEAFPDGEQTRLRRKMHLYLTWNAMSLSAVQKSSLAMRRREWWKMVRLIFWGSWRYRRRLSLLRMTNLIGRGWVLVLIERKKSDLRLSMAMVERTCVRLNELLLVRGRGGSLLALRDQK